LVLLGVNSAAIAVSARGLPRTSAFPTFDGKEVSARALVKLGGFSNASATDTVLVVSAELKSLAEKRLVPRPDRNDLEKPLLVFPVGVDAPASTLSISHSLNSAVGSFGKILSKSDAVNSSFGRLSTFWL
jgi:hypothetical protein